MVIGKKGQAATEFLISYGWVIFFLIISLIDNGTGIMDVKKAITPYFTTKQKGTGLGLPIVTKIINEHSGNFLIQNNKNGIGTVITISFPKLNA